MQTGLCANHFEESQFMNSQRQDSSVWNAVPTLFNVPNPPKMLLFSRKPPRSTSQTTRNQLKDCGKKTRYKLNVIEHNNNNNLSCFKYQGVKPHSDLQCVP